MNLFSDGLNEYVATTHFTKQTETKRNAWQGEYWEYFRALFVVFSHCVSSQNIVWRIARETPGWFTLQDLAWSNTEFSLLPRKQRKRQKLHMSYSRFLTRGTSSSKFKSLSVFKMWPKKRSESQNMAIGAYFTLALKSRLNSRVIDQYFMAMHGRSRLPKVGVSNPASHFPVS